MRGTARRRSLDFSDGPPDLTKYIGRRYEHTNCWDLARELYLCEFGIELPQYYLSDLSPDTVEGLIVQHKNIFLQAEGDLRFGDIVLMKISGLECHIGIYALQGKVLHTMKGTGSILDSLERRKKVISGYYRHRSLAA